MDFYEEYRVRELTINGTSHTPREGEDYIEFGIDWDIFDNEATIFAIKFKDEWFRNVDFIEVLELERKFSEQALESFNREFDVNEFS